MKSIVFVCTASALCLSLAACNKNTGGPESIRSGLLAPAEQKKRLLEVQSARNFAQLAIPAESGEDPAFGRCKIVKSGLDSATSGAIDPLGEEMGTLEVSGAGCPVSYNVSRAAISSGGMEYSASYSVQDAAYRKQNDVDSFTTSLKLEWISNSDGTLATIRASVESRIHSQKFGTLVETGSGTGTASYFEMQVKEAFGDFAIERVAGFSTERSGTKSFHYSVNGRPVTKEEFESYGQVDLPVR